MPSMCLARWPAAWQPLRAAPKAVKGSAPSRPSRSSKTPPEGSSARRPPRASRTRRAPVPPYRFSGRLDGVLEALDHSAGAWTAVVPAESNLDATLATDASALRDSLLRHAGLPSDVVIASDALYRAVHGVRPDPESHRRAEALVNEAATPGFCESVAEGCADRQAPTATGSAPERASGSVVAAARRSLGELADPADPHADDRAALARQLSELCLLESDSEVADLSRYAGRSRAYENAFSTAIADELPELQIRVTEAVAALTDGVTVSATFDDEFAGELAALVVDCRAATARYLDEIDQALVAARAEDTFIAAAKGLLANSDEHFSRGDRLRALMRLGEAAVPVLADWAPSIDYRASLTAAIVRLRDLADRFVATSATWTKETGETLARASAEISRAVTQTAESCGEQRERAWEELNQAGEDVIVQAAASLAEPERRDSALPIQAATTMFLVDDFATARLGAAATELIPQPPAGDATAADGDVNEPDALLHRLHMNSLVWAAANVPVLAVLDSEAVGGEALAHPLAPLAGLPDHLVRAHADVCSYVHSGFTHDVGRTCHELIGSVKANILPNVSGVSAPHQVILQAGTHHVAASASTAMSPQDSLLGELLRSDGLAPAAAHYLEANAVHAGEFFLHTAGASPQIHDAIGQLGNAADLGGTAVLHAVAGHIPVVTLALSASREIQLRRERELAVAQSVRNVMIDVGGVTVGLGTTVVAASIVGLHGLAAAPVTVPGAIAGAVGAKVYKRRRYLKAVALYEQRRSEYEVACRQVQADYAQEIRNVVVEQRAALTQEISDPAPLESDTRSNLQEPVAELQRAACRYLERARALIDAATQVQAARASADAPLEGIQQRLRAGEQALAAGERDIVQGRFAAALMHVAEASPPLVAWHPSLEYEAACTSAAQRISALADSHREEIGQWIKNTARQIETHMTAIETAVKGSLETRLERLATAEGPVQEALKLVETHCPVEMSAG